MAIPDELQTFVKEALSRGLARADIQAALKQAGWEEEQVDSALSNYSEVAFPVPIPRPRPHLSARETFFYLVLFSTLYISAANLGTILFQLIYMLVPDATTGYYPGPDAIRSAVRWAVSGLVVAFPVYLYLSRRTNREVQRDPAKRSSGVRRWLTYLTVFIASVALIADVIVLLNDVLAGEVTLRFLLKTVTVAVIAGGIFLHYLRELRSEERA